MSRLLVPLTLLAAMAAAAAAGEFPQNDTSRYIAMMREVALLPPGAPLAGGEVREFALRAPRAPGKHTVLLVEARMDSVQYGGCNYGMSLTINGHSLAEAIDRMNRRLLGKHPVAHVKNYPGGAEGPWRRGDWWLLIYGPGFASQQIEEGDDCLFLWDVTDLLRAEGDDVVRIESQTKRLEEQIKRPVPLAIGRFQYGLIDDAELAKTLPAPLPVPPANPKLQLKGKGFSCWLAPGGGMVVSVGKETFLLRSRFSYPGQPQGGWNVLEPAAKTTGEALWRPELGQGADGSLHVRGGGRMVSLHRQITLAGHRVLVRDTFRNLTDRLVGLQFRDEVDCTGKPVREVDIAGNPDPNVTTDSLCGDNSTLFVRPRAEGLGLLMEDDVARVQGVIECAYPIAGLGSSHFGLAPQGSYTVEWALYPAASGDVWDFINQVRRDWNVNFTIPAGSFWCDCGSLTPMKDEDLKRYIDWSGGTWIMATPWLDCWPLPTRPTYAEIAKTEQATREKLRRCAPDARLLLGTHPTMNFATPGTGFDGPDYRDSFILDAEGKHFWSPTYTNYFVIGIAKEQGYLNFCNFMERRGASPGNSYYGKMIREADFALDEARSDGVYCDEFNHYNNLSPRTFGQWDGHWADLDPVTFEVKTDKQMAQLSLVTDEAQEQYAKHILGKGAIFLANAQPVTRRMQNLHFPRFVETPYPERAFHSALFSPLVFGNDVHTLKDAELFQFVRARLECCALTHIGGMPKLTRPCLTARMFPFTPVDIRPGVMTGVERIITTKSGLYGWKGTFQARLFVYDRDGVLAEAQPAAKTYRAKVRVEVPEEGAVVLERG